MIQLCDTCSDAKFSTSTSWRSSVEIANGVLELIGDTPLVRLKRNLDINDVDLIVKFKAANPGGGARDRPAARVIEHAMESGLIEAGTTIIESTSGNRGIGLAQACRFYGLKLVCVVDPNAHWQNVATTKALGAQIELVSEVVNNDFLTARLERVSQLNRKIDKSCWTNQYANLQNPQSHSEGTTREIDNALNGEFDYLFVATSSTGTVRGCREYLESRGSNATVRAVDVSGNQNLDTIFLDKWENERLGLPSDELSSMVGAN